MSVPSPDASAIALARARFLSDESFDVRAVRGPVLASWNRSRRLHVAPDRIELGHERDYRASPLAEVAAPVLDDLADRLATEPVSVILCDDQGVVLRRQTGDPGLQHHLNRIWLAPGFSYAECYAGTNGIGTALETRAGVQVMGGEHYVEQLADLACAAVPIRHPVTGRALGVFNLTGWNRQMNALMMATAALVAGQIEERLRDRLGLRDAALLGAYRAACHPAGAGGTDQVVLAVGTDLLMMNDRARQLLDPADLGPLVAAVTSASVRGRREPVVVDDLPSGSLVRAHWWVDPWPSDATSPGTPTGTSPGTPPGAGTKDCGVLFVEVVAAPVRRPGADPARPGTSAPPGRGRPVGGRAGSALPPAVVGTGTPWARCVEAVDRHFVAQEWLVLSGEPGSGKCALALAAHARRTPAAHRRMMDAREAGADRGRGAAAWLAEVDTELRSGPGTLVLAHVDELRADLVPHLVDLLAPYGATSPVGTAFGVGTTGAAGTTSGAERPWVSGAERPWVVATCGPGPVAGELAEFVACFPRTVEVPPLRHHLDDVPELVRQFAARPPRGVDLTWSPEALRVLMRNRWPGNIDQLRQVVRHVVSRRRGGVVEVTDLPAETFATVRRVLTPLEAMECDAIVGALVAADGNKARAAARLGMSRATIYRKVRDYGISLPTRTTAPTAAGASG